MCLWFSLRFEVSDHCAFSAFPAVARMLKEFLFLKTGCWQRGTACVDWWQETLFYYHLLALHLPFTVMFSYF